MTSLVDLQKALDKQAKTLNEWITDVPRRSYLAYGKKRLISVETVTAVLQKVLHEKTVAEEKNVEYAKLVAAQAKEYAEKQSGKEQALRKLLEDWPVFPPFASLPDDIPETVLTYCLKTLQLKKSFEKVFDEVFFAKKGSFMGETAKP